MSYGTGNPSPAWMESAESIEAVAARYRARVPELIDLHGGSLIMGSHENGEVLCVEDRATGQVFYAPHGAVAIGEILKLNWRCPHGTDVHVFPMCLKIVREVPISEVRAMAERNAAGVRFRLATRAWYEVWVD